MASDWGGEVSQEGIGESIRIVLPVSQFRWQSRFSACRENHKIANGCRRDGIDETALASTFGSMSQHFKSLRSLLHEPAAKNIKEACWQPPVDVYRAGTAWLVKFDLAGVRKEDIQVELNGCRLTVRGVRRDLTILDGQRAYSMEIAYNQFERVVELPVNVETARFASDYRDGMFLVSITSTASHGAKDE